MSVLPVFSAFVVMFVAVTGTTCSTGCSNSYPCYSCCATVCTSDGKLQENGACRSGSSCTSGFSLTSQITWFDNVYNYNQKAYRYWTSFCTPDNCAVKVSGDCSKCQTCTSGYTLCPASGVCMLGGAPTLNPSSCPSTQYISGYGKTTVSAVVSGPSGTAPCGSASQYCNVTNFSALSVQSSPVYVSCTVKDAASGAVATTNCPVFKIIIDSIPPSISCPSDVNVVPSGGAPTVSVPYSVTATDDFTPSPTISCNYASGYAFPIGSTTVTCTATDSVANSKSCSFKVNNVDTVSPVITCPSNIIANPTIGSPQVTLSAYTPTLTATDGSGIQSASCSPAATSQTPYTFPLGTTTVTCNARDNAGLSSSCTFTVTVVDITPPVISCPTTFTYTTLPSDNRPDPVVNFASTVSATDGSGIASISCPDSGVTRFNVSAVSTVYCTATDKAGLKSNCSISIVVVDNANPALTCPSSLNVSPSNGTSTVAVASFLVPAATDNSGIMTPTSCSISSPANIGLGITTVTCQATDYARKTTSCSFNITNTDQTQPTLNCPPYSTSTPLRVTPKNGNAPSEVASWTFSAQDNSGIASASCTPASGSTFTLGKTNVSCSAIDNAGNMKQCPIFSVEVFDSTPPTLICPISLNLKPDGQPSVVATYSIAPTDGSGILQSSCLPSSGSLFPVGTTTVNCSATDNVNLKTSCSFTVAVNQNPAPSIICPGNQIIQTSGNLLSAPASFSASASDVPDVAVSVACNPSSLSIFLFGNNTVTCTATNIYGLKSSCAFYVNVIDTIAPVLSCPANLNLKPELGKSFVSASYTPTAIDNSGIKGITCVPASGAQFDVATTTVVTCTAQDNALLSSSCQFSVTVVDNVPPQIVCPNDISSSPAQGQTTASVVLPPVTAIDNVAIQKTNCSRSSGSIFSLGPTLVVCNAYDTTGNSASCQYTVFIGDVTPPSITCSGNITSFTSPNSNAAVINWNPAVATDNSGIVSVLCTQAGVTSFPVGTTAVTCLAADQSLNSASCSFTITVVDNQDPDVFCPNDISESFGIGQNSKTIAWSFSADDNVGVASASCSPASGTSFSFGDSLVTCSATDYSGRTKSCSFKVIMTDNQPPIVTCPAAYIGQTSAGLRTGIVRWRAPSQADDTVYDNVGVAFVSCSVPLSQVEFPLGQTQIICTGYDLAQNTASCQFQITIQDREPPAILCPPSLTGVILAGDPRTFTNLYFDALPVPTDNVGVVNSSLQRAGVIIDPNSDYSQIYLGRTFFTYTAVDTAGNSASCTFSGTVTKEGGVVDTVPPTIACPPQQNYIFSNDRGTASAIASWPVITVTDNIGVTSTQTVTTPPGLYRGAAFPIGNSSIHFIASDAAGNFAECLFFVTVIDTEAPKAICPNSFVQNCNPPFNRANVSWFPPTFTDNVGLLATTVSRLPGEYLAGSYEVDASAIDNSGNSVNCSFSFTIVTDTTPPAVKCPSSLNKVTDFGKATAMVNWVTPVITDNTGIASAVYQPSQYYPPASFPVGSTLMKYTVTDLFGNTKACSFRVTVADKEPPTITCPGSFQTQIFSGDSVLVSWQDPFATDNVGISKIIQSYQPQKLYSAGVYVVEAYANDTSGLLSGMCNFTFTVLPASSASSSSSTAAVGAGAGAGSLILIGLVIVVLWTRFQRRKMRQLEEQYGNLDMSDEAVLARAQAIQQALQNKKRNASPNIKWLQVPPIVFQPPPKTLAEMAKYLAQFGDREIPRENVVIESEIGAGEFGSVCSGHVKKADGSKLTIAIKTLKDSSNSKSKLKFLQEASIMIQFKHPKIVALVGVVTKSEPALICLEFCELGSLRSYLKSEFVFEKLTDSDLIRMACDVCSAMHYLGESGFVHRDLAARNVLVNKDFICKVCDFGLSQETTSNSDNAKDEKIPIRWTAPEAVLHHQFSTASDVWSFGILLWEMWSYGAMPYKGWSNDIVMQHVTKGYRMPNPKNCPSFIHGLMLECWNEEYDQRPAFSDVFARLLAAWNICKPLTNYAKTYTYDENGNKIAAPAGKSKKTAAPVEEDNEDDMYDMGGDGGKVKAEKIEIAAPSTGNDDDDGDMYDMGGDGGKVKAEKVPLQPQNESQDDDDYDMYDMGGAGGKIKQSNHVDEGVLNELTEQLHGSIQIMRADTRIQVPEHSEDDQMFDTDGNPTDFGTDNLNNDESDFDLIDIPVPSYFTTPVISPLHLSPALSLDDLRDMMPDGYLDIDENDDTK